MSKFDDVPLKYITLIDFEKVSMITQEFKLVNGEVVKLETPKYDNENDELLLLILLEVNIVITAYDMFNLLNATTVYDRFRVCLRGTL